MSSNPDTTPALAPPPGETSNFSDPYSIQGAIVAGLTVCLFVSTLSAVVRCYAQWKLFGRLAWADFFMLSGWVFHVAFAAFLFACLPYGAGRHQWNVSVTQDSKIKFFLFIDFVLYDFAILGGKLSILLQLQAIFVSRHRNMFFWATAFLIVVNVVFYVALSFALIFQCQPIAKGWDSSTPGTCLNQAALLESSGPFNIVSDILIFLLPVHSIWQLKLPQKKRMAVASAFTVGLFGCLCSVVRLLYSYRLGSSGDATYLIFQNQLWANAEISAALLIANLIIVPRFIRHRRQRGSLSYNYQSSHSYGQPQAPAVPPKSWDGGRTRSSDQTYPQRPQHHDPYIKLADVSIIKSDNSILQRREQAHWSMDDPSSGTDGINHVVATKP